MCVDFKKGYGGKFGVQSDRVDKGATGFAEKEETVPPSSVTDFKKGYGGKVCFHFSYFLTAYDCYSIFDAHSN